MPSRSADLRMLEEGPTIDGMERKRGKLTKIEGGSSNKIVVRRKVQQRRKIENIKIQKK